MSEQIDPPPSYVEEFNGVWRTWLSHIFERSKESITSGEVDSITTEMLEDGSVTEDKLSFSPGGGSSYYIYGLTLSNNATDANKDIDIDTGECALDDFSSATLSTGLTKQLDASWASGTNAGGLSSSLTVAANTTYHVFLVLIGGSEDVLFDTDVDCANGITDHTVTAYRRIGSIITDGSVNIYGFVQRGDHFRYDALKVIFSRTSAATNVTVATISPLGIEVKIFVHGIVSTSGKYGRIKVADGNSNISPIDLCGHVDTAGSNFAAGWAEIWTNTSTQMRYSTTAGLAAMSLYISGWEDYRGRL